MREKYRKPNRMGSENVKQRSYPHTTSPPKKGGGGCTQFVHGRIRMTIYRRISAMLGRSTRVCTNQADFTNQAEVGGGAYSFVACLSQLTIDQGSISRRSTVPIPNRNTSNIWALIMLFPYTTWNMFAHPIPVLFRRLRPPFFP